MLTEFFESPVRIQELRDGPEGRLLEGFAQEFLPGGLCRDHSSQAHSSRRAPDA